MDLSYSAEYERFRAESRAFLDKHWTDEDRARARRGAGDRRDPHRPPRETAFRSQAIARGYLYRHVPRATAAASSRPIR